VLQNSRNAGAITAALYLHEYVKARNGEEEPDWVHVDFSATHADAKPGRQLGFGPMGMRAAFEFIRAKYVR
jgi:leucyl aminopeptidase